MSIPRRTFKSPIEAPQDDVGEPAGEVAAAAPADEAPAPEGALQRAQAAMASNDADIARLVVERNALLVCDEVDEVAVGRLDDELAQHQRRQKTLSDRLDLLAAEATRAEAERAARAREAAIIETEHLFVSRDAAVADLRDHLVAAEQAFRRVYELGLAARGNWAWPHGTSGATMTSVGDLTQAVSSFLFKIGGRPSQTGGTHQASVPPAFPGGRCPKIEWLQTPDKLPDLVAEYRLASKHASDVMRGVRVDAVPASPAMNGAAQPHLPANASPAEAGQSSVGPPPQAAPQNSSPNPALARILARQNALASRLMTPAEEAEYTSNGLLIQELSA